MSNNEPLSPEQPAADAAPEPQLPRPRRTHPILRALGILVAIVAAALMAVVTIDLGPTFRHKAEVAASNYIDRPMHIGKLKIELLSGTFQLDDVVIEGLKPTDRPPAASTDAELLLRSARSSAAFRVFYDRHVVRVHQFMLRRTSDPVSAFELTDETFEDEPGKRLEDLLRQYGTTVADLLGA